MRGPDAKPHAAQSLSAIYPLKLPNSTRPAAPGGKKLSHCKASQPKNRPKSLIRRWHAAWSKKPSHCNTSQPENSRKSLIWPPRTWPAKSQPHHHIPQLLRCRDQCPAKNTCDANASQRKLPNLPNQPHLTDMAITKQTPQAIPTTPVMLLQSQSTTTDHEERVSSQQGS